MPRTEKCEYQRQGSIEKEEQILEGAIPEFLKSGYACTSMDRVAKAAGVSKQTLYSYFSDKDGLFTVLVKRMASRKFQLVWSQPLAGEPAIVLHDLAYRLMKVNIKDSEYLCFVRLIVSESGNRPDLAKLFLSNIAKPAMEVLTKYLQELKIAEPDTTARIFVGSLIYFIINQEVLYGKEIMPMPAEHFIDRLVEMVVSQIPS